jgi:DNA processing protein
MALAYFAARLLMRLPEVGVATYWKLVDHFGSPDNCINAAESQLSPWLKPRALEALREYRLRGDASLIGQQLARDQAYMANHQDVYLLGVDDPLYPQLLLQISKPPPLLYVRGNPTVLSLPQLALVGSRRPTVGGRETAHSFANYLAARGFVITSGLAIGIDAAAHEGALSVDGLTVAVMGTGIDSIYPHRHQGLADAIVQRGGALVSEFPLGTASHASHFPQRNRLISGLSLGTLVVEAAVQSGSLITASYALQHNREVFAIPGSIHNPLARGCHQLIRQGATLVETADDIVGQLDGFLQLKRAESKPLRALVPEPRVLKGNFDCNEVHLLDALGFDPVPMDLLLQRISMDVGVIISCLMGLEIKGVVQQTERGYVRLH